MAKVTRGPVVVALVAVLVLFVALAASRDRPTEHALDGYRPATGGASLTVVYTTGAPPPVVTPAVAETPDSVTVTLYAHRPAAGRPGGSPTGGRVERDLRVNLQQPLGSRTVIDGSTGKPLDVVTR